ncbi:MAG: hypothetical protein V1835_01695 [Candidatus Micrarchaeota archaeon]
MRILIAYASKKGFAKRLADHIAQGCRAAGVAPDLKDLKDSFKLFDYLHFVPFLPRSKASIDHDLPHYDLIFIGFEIHNISQSSKLLEFIEGNDFGGKRVALFCSYFINRKYLQRVVEKFEKRHAQVYNTISLKRKGLDAFIGLGATDENDLIRAEAFAERTINNLLGRKIFKENEKGQIRNYRK